jgi:glycoside/pentoside/hexuronide:cation symporter, GPH family
MHAMAAAARPARIPGTRVIAYGIFGLPLAMAALPIYVHVPRFYADTLGVSLAQLGALLLVLRLADGVLDPLIGKYSDRSRSRRRLVLLAGPFLAVGMIALFAPPVRGAAALLAWLAVSLAIVYAAFSVATINHGAWGAELADSVEERTRITATREVLALVGVVLASVLPSVLVTSLGATAGMSAFGLIFGLVVLTCAAILWLAPDRGAAIAVPRDASPLLVLRDRPFVRLLATYTVNGIASAIPATLVLFYISDVLQATEWEGGLLAIYFIAAATGMPLWVALAARKGKLFAWASAMALSIAAFAWTLGLASGDVVPFAIVCALSGVALGADLALPPSALADVIDRREAVAAAGVYFGVWTLATKLNLALAAGVALPLLALLGYESGSRDATALRALTLVYGLVPCVLKLVAAALVFGLMRDARRA